MSKFKDFIKRNFFPVSTSIDILTKELKECQKQLNNDPTVRDLFKTKIDDNVENISIWKKHIRKLIYKEWVVSINKKQNLKWDDDHEIKGVDYTFSVLIRHDGNELIKDAAAGVLEDILAEHPDIRFTITPQSNSEIYKFDYSDCLNDTIPLDVFEGDTIDLIERWKTKRNR